jgi:hypothetical protein
MVLNKVRKKTQNLPFLDIKVLWYLVQMFEIALFKRYSLYSIVNISAVNNPLKYFLFNLLLF